MGQKKILNHTFKQIIKLKKRNKVNKIDILQF